MIPISAGDFDDLIGTLQKTLGLTVFMVTHDLDSLFAICDRVAVLGHKKVIASGPISELLLSDDPWLKAYFHGKRGVIRLAAAAERPAERRCGRTAAEREALSRMETRANYVLIGAFTLAAVVGAFLFIMWIAGYGAAGGHRAFQVVFKGSVSGLSNGANVLFNGIKVGEVTHLTFSRSDPHQVVADIDVGSEAPIDQNTKARLETQGLTGAAAVALLGGVDAGRPLVGENGQAPVIYAEQSLQLQDIIDNVAAVSVKATSVLDDADKLIADNSEPIHSAIANVDQFSKALADNSRRESTRR